MCDRRISGMAGFLLCYLYQSQKRDTRANGIASDAGGRRERQNMMRPDLCVKCKYFPNFLATWDFVSHIIVLTETNFTNNIHCIICWDTVI